MSVIVARHQIAGGGKETDGVAVSADPRNQAPAIRGGSVDAGGNAGQHHAGGAGWNHAEAGVAHEDVFDSIHRATQVRSERRERDELTRGVSAGVLAQAIGGRDAVGR